MKKLIILLLLSGCALDPVVIRNYRKPYKQRVVECTERFMDGFNTNIKSTYQVCKDLERGRK